MERILVPTTLWYQGGLNSRIEFERDDTTHDAEIAVISDFVDDFVEKIKDKL